MSYDVSNFQEEVLEASHEKPVLADFWAPWCGPCRQLSPNLEALAQEDAERWTLAKVNTEEHPEVAQQQGIRGIPNVKLFVDGEVVDEFTGARPKHAIKKWLDNALPTEEKKRLQKAKKALESDDYDAAEQLLRSVLEKDPDNAEAKVLLARTLVLDEPKEARELVDSADVAQRNLLDTKEAIQTLARAMRLYDEPAELPDGDVKETYQSALKALRQHDFDAAIERFVQVIQADRYYDDDGARKACVALFTLLGNDHPAVRQHRRKFDMALY